MLNDNSDADHFKKWFDLGMNADIGIGNFFEYIIQTIYISILEPGDISIDAGANRGLHTIPMTRIVGKKGMVIGFEAIPELASNLIDKLLEMQIKNVLIKSLAIGEKKGIVDFNYVKDSDYHSGIKEQQGIPDSAKKSILKISVPLSTLDFEIDSEKKVRFMKLDLEGGEYHGLIGAQRIMNDDKPLIVFENNRETAATLYNYRSSDWFSLFEERSYKVYDLFGRNFTPEKWDTKKMPWYFIAAKRESDQKFVTERLPHLIGILYLIFKRHSLLK